MLCSAELSMKKSFITSGLVDFPPFYVNETSFITSYLHSRAHLFKANDVVS